VLFDLIVLASVFTTMPKEIRKRGKKHKKSQKEDEYDLHRPEAPAAVPVPQEEDHQAEGPSWIISGKKVEDVNPEAPFGYVELDVKAYFRTVDVQIREWQDAREEEHQPDPEDDSDPNERMSNFLVNRISSKTNLCRKETILRLCYDRNARQGKAACNRRRVFRYP